jgi:hypothetical protein
MTGGASFDLPLNPGNYSSGIATNASAGAQAKADTEHKELIAQYEILKGAEQALKDVIVIKAVEEDYFWKLKIKSSASLTKHPEA